MAKGKFIDVTLRLIDKMTSPLNSAGQALSRHAMQYQRAGRQIQKAGKQISAVGGGMTKNFTIPIAGAGVAAIKLASDFESGMSKVSSISGATGGELDKLSKKAKEMGAKTKFSATEATEAYQYMAMAGWRAGDMLNGIEPIMKLAGATGEDLATTSDIVTDAITAFGMKSSDTQTFVDLLAKTASSANTNVSMLGESFKYVAPVAGSLGYSAADTSKMLGIMADSGIKASTAGTSLRSALSRMASPTKDVKSAMNALGISLTDSKGNMKSLDTVMGEMRGSFSKLTETQKAQYAASIAGKTGMSGLLAIVNSSDEEWNKMTKAMKESTGAANKMYETANDNLNGSLTVLKSTVESIAISFGERMTPYVKKATEWVQKMADKFNALTPSQQDMIIKVGLVVASIGPMLMIFGKTVTTVGKVAHAFGTLGKWFKTFGTLAGIVKAPAGMVIGSIAGIALAALLIYKNWDKIEPMFKKIMKSIGPTLKNVAKVVQSVANGIIKEAKKLYKASEPLIKSAIKLIEKIAGVIGKVLIKAVDSTIPVLKSLGKTCKIVFGLLADIVIEAVVNISEVIQRLTPVFSVVFDSIGTVVSAAGTVISAGIEGIMITCNGIIEFINGVFCGDWKAAWQGIVDGFGWIFEGITDLCKTPLNAVINLINSAIKGINKINVEIPDWVPGMGGEKLGFSIPTIPTLAKGTKNWQGGIVQISEKGGEIVDLPQGSRVYPHDQSVKKAYSDGAKSSEKKVVFKIERLADMIVVREEADIDKIVQKLADKLEKKSQNIGGEEIGYVF